MGDEEWVDNNFKRSVLKIFEEITEHVVWNEQYHFRSLFEDIVQNLRYFSYILSLYLFQGCVYYFYAFKMDSSGSCVWFCNNCIHFKILLLSICTSCILSMSCGRLQFLSIKISDFTALFYPFLCVYLYFSFFVDVDTFMTCSSRLIIYWKAVLKIIPNAVIFEFWIIVMRGSIRHNRWLAYANDIHLYFLAAELLVVLFNNLGIQPT